MAEHIDQPWLHRPQLQALLALLNDGEGEAKIAGGAVRNSLLDQPIADVDVATTLVPSEVVERLKSAGHKSVPTGIDHGTVTAIIDGDAYEVTTLRADVETDGRHATVVFGTDWEADARRRDLTMNALYLDADGTVFDPLGGMQDVLAARVVFIDDATQRIREDYLRILRFFRFFAWYGKFRPDADGLRACAREKDGLEGLSAERVWQELSKMLAAPDPVRAVLWMRQTGVLSKILPESENWGIDGIHPLIETEKERKWEPDAVLRLMAILPPMEERVASATERLKLPNSVRDRLLAWAQLELPAAKTKQEAFARFLYRTNNDQAVTDRLRLAIATSDADAKKRRRQLKWLKRWQRPILPVRGADLIAAGMEPGPAISERLSKMEERWIDSDFALSSEELLTGI
ncbi:CCA tRNA nucleotidyltransferase [Ahrensia sp. R2A130]|uniref:CCA tRNA nucleotidyltransferase n=1 Tax=Ahrensia sp. R2A130 TaxID=744979 RepID=UPI0001E0F8B0|nr:CCA tRNA nucleotidyltransferase [Ahrensia sp. R2A130]EFL89053.1 tRNA-nucleotidyltransferase 1 [Ahrensia sp. R2A130]